MTPREELHRRAILHDQAAFLLREEDPLLHEQAAARHEFVAKLLKQEAGRLEESLK